MSVWMHEQLNALLISALQIKAPRQFQSVQCRELCTIPLLITGVLKSDPLDCMGCLLKGDHRQLSIGRACMPGGPMGSQRAPGGSPAPPPMRPRPPPKRPANSGSSGPTCMPPPLTPGRPPPPRGPPMPGRSGAPGGRMPGGATSLPPTGGKAGRRGRSTAWSNETCR